MDRRLFTLLLALCVGSGCVNRRLTVRTDPPGALVEVNGKRAGLSPVSMDFKYYGVNEITVSAPGYETATIHQPTPPPWYQIPPFDLFSDNLLLGRTTDRREFMYRLQPLPSAGSPGSPDNENGLIQRGRDFRSSVLLGR